VSRIVILMLLGTVLLSGCQSQPATPLEQGKQLYHQGQWQLALDWLDQAITDDPASADAHIYRGRTFFADGDTDAAIADYRRAIDLAPDDCEAYYHRAIAYRAQGKADLAKSDEQRARRLDRRLEFAYKTDTPRVASPLADRSVGSSVDTSQDDEQSPVASRVELPIAEIEESTDPVAALEASDEVPSDQNVPVAATTANGSPTLETAYEKYLKTIQPTEITEQGVLPSPRGNLPLFATSEVQPTPPENRRLGVTALREHRFKLTDDASPDQPFSLRRNGRVDTPFTRPEGRLHSSGLQRGLQNGTSLRTPRSTLRTTGLHSRLSSQPPTDPSINSSPGRLGQSPTGSTLDNPLTRRAAGRSAGPQRHPSGQRPGAGQSGPSRGRHAGPSTSLRRPGGPSRPHPSTRRPSTHRPTTAIPSGR
jgi:hypothetical protein